MAQARRAPGVSGGEVAAPEVRALHQNLIDHYAFHARLVGSEFHRESDVVWYLSGRAVNFFNAVVGASFAPAASARRVDEVLAPFQERGVPMRWWTDERGLASDLNGLLEARGLLLMWDVPGMAVDLRDGLRDAHVPRSAIDVRRVRDREDLRTWVETFATAYGIGAADADVWFAALDELGLDPGLPVRHYVAWSGDRPVGTSTVHLYDGTVGVYHVGTVPESRRSGVGSAATLVPLVEARDEGFRWGVLKASHLGRGVYERLGFAECSRMRQYRWAPAS